MNELETLLRSILKEELEPINKRLDSMDKRLDNLELSVNEVKVGQETLRKDIIDVLGGFTEKIATEIDIRTSVLNNRVFKTETEIAKLKNRLEA